MKILLIALAAVSLAAGYGNPARELAEGKGKPGTQVPQNLSPESLMHSGQEHPLAPRANFQVSRQEYRRFGKDAFSTNTQSDISGYNPDYETFDERNKFGQNAESQSNKKQSYKFPPVEQNQGAEFQKSNAYQQDLLKSDTPYSPESQAKQFSNQDIHKPGQQGAQEKSSFAEFHGQEAAQRGTPFSVENQSQIRSGMHNNQNEFRSRFPSAQNQGYQAQQGEFQNQDRFNPASVENQQAQFQRRPFFQNDAREESGINQDKQSAFPTQQDQFKAPRAPQEQLNQYQQNKQSQQAPTGFAREAFFNQQQNGFDSKRISPSVASRQSFQSVTEGQEKYIPTPTQFRSNQPQKAQETHVEDARFSTDIHFKEDANKQNRILSNKFDTGSRTQDLSQGLFQNLGREQPVSTLPQFRQTHSTSVLVSGTKGVAAPPPVMVYKTGSIASPHAVVISKNQDAANKASISQHLQTPFAQYTYSHPL